MVDAERVDRLLVRIRRDVDALARLRDSDFRDSDAPTASTDATALAAVKYLFVTAIEGCARVAQHLIASEGWPVADDNASAVRQLIEHDVIDRPTGEAVAQAVGFRNVLVHEYVDVDDERVLAHLDRLQDLEQYVAGVASWLDREPIEVRPSLTAREDEPTWLAGKPTVSSITGGAVDGEEESHGGGGGDEEE